MKNLHQQLSINKLIVLLLFIFSSAVFSCSPSQKETKPEQVQQQIQTLQTLVEPEIQAQVTPVQENNTVETEKPAEVVILNPPHGEPFHLCEVPVGSPISVPASAVAASASASATAAATNTTVNVPVNRSGTAPTIENAARLSGGQMNTSSAQPLATSTQPRLNPPHGEPFHRCDIAVGSPLPVN
jgi:hypothetical protein